jgi:hypothetical protein
VRGLVNGIGYPVPISTIAQLPCNLFIFLDKCNLLIKYITKVKKAATYIIM